MFIEQVKVPYIKGTVVGCYGDADSVIELELTRGEKRIYPFSDCTIPDEFPDKVIAMVSTSNGICYVLLDNPKIGYITQSLSMESLRLNSMTRLVLLFDKHDKDTLL